MSLKNAHLVTAAALAAVVVGTPLKAQSATDVMDKAVAAWANVKSMSGTFEQTLTNTLLGTTGVAHGTFSQQRPNKLAIRFTDPSGDVIIADGKYIWAYLKQSAPDKVIKRPESDRDDIPLDISQFLDGATERFDIARTGAESVNGHPTQILSLTPRKGTRTTFTKATVWIDDADGLVRQFEVNEGNNLIRRIKLTTVTLNPAIPASEFVYAIPKGVKVVTP